MKRKINPFDVAMNVLIWGCLVVFAVFILIIFPVAIMVGSEGRYWPMAFIPWYVVAIIGVPWLLSKGSEWWDRKYG